MTILVLIVRYELLCLNMFSSQIAQRNQRYDFMVQKAEMTRSWGAANRVKLRRGDFSPLREDVDSYRFVLIRS